MSKHQEIMLAESTQGDQSLVDLALEYHEWAVDEVMLRLTILESFANGEQLLTAAGIRQSKDAFIGIVHVGVLVRSALERHETAVPALLEKTYQHICHCVGKAKEYYEELKSIVAMIELAEAESSATFKSESINIFSATQTMADFEQKPL